MQESARISNKKPPIENIQFVVYIKEIHPTFYYNLNFDEGLINKHGQMSDGWGTPFVLLESDDGFVKIRSFGKNKKDDLGRGDDMELIFPLFIQ